MRRAAIMEESFEAMTIGKLLYLVFFGELAIRSLDAPKTPNQSRETKESDSGTGMKSSEIEVPGPWVK
jgi:hypothetical protein